MVKKILISLYLAKQLYFLYLIDIVCQQAFFSNKNTNLCLFVYGICKSVQRCRPSALSNLWFANKISASIIKKVSHLNHIER